MKIWNGILLDDIENLLCSVIHTNSYLFQIIMKHRASGGIKTIISHLACKDEILNTHGGGDDLLDTYRDRQMARWQKFTGHCWSVIIDYWSYLSDYLELILPRWMPSVAGRRSKATAGRMSDNYWSGHSACHLQHGTCGSLIKQIREN